MARLARPNRSARRGLAPVVIFGLLAAAVAAIFVGRTLVGRLNGSSPDAALDSRPAFDFASLDPGPGTDSAASATVSDPLPSTSTPAATGPSALAAAKAEAQAAYQAFVAASSSGNAATFEAAKTRLAAAEKAYREALGST